MSGKILWFTDRFGIHGAYRAVWTRLLAGAGISVTRVRVISLHEQLKGTLLASLGNRKAPTWREDREHEIREQMQKDIQLYQPSVVVLSSPESLCVTDLRPEHATLHNLRGSLYSVFGVPALVILPMSAWTTQVSIKSTGEANYGESDEESFEQLVERQQEFPLVLDEESEQEADDFDSDLDTDTFYYEPVIVPVGKFMLKADVAKLFRIWSGNMFEPFNAY